MRDFGSVNISSRRILGSESKSISELTGGALHELTSTHACPRNVDSALPATDVPPITFAVVGPYELLTFSLFARGMRGAE